MMFFRTWLEKYQFLLASVVYTYLRFLLHSGSMSSHRVTDIRGMGNYIIFYRGLYFGTKTIFIPPPPF
jgi:hypothetical protein